MKITLIPNLSAKLSKMSDNLEVFGYSSKIFHDDVAATHIDEEKHMHPHELDLLTTIDR